MASEDKPEEPKTERFNMFMSPSEMKAIDEWAWNNRIRSKSEAVRRLCQMGLQADESIEAIRAQSDGTYEFIAGRLDQLFKDLRSTDKAIDLANAINSAMTAVVDTMQMVGNLSSTVRQASEQANTLKGDDDIVNLMEKAKDVEREYNVTRKRIREMLERNGDK